MTTLQKVLAILVYAVFLVQCKTSEPTGARVQSTGGGTSDYQTYDQALTYLTQLPPILGNDETIVATRVSGCWKNPAAKDWTAIKKTIYCNYPLEFRICNSLVLAQTKDAEKDLRAQAYDACAKSSGLDSYLSQDGVRRLYVELFLPVAPTLATQDVDALVTKYRPVVLTDDFPVLLAKIIPVIIKQHGGVAASALILQTITKPVRDLLDDHIARGLDRVTSEDEYKDFLEHVL